MAASQLFGVSVVIPFYNSAGTLLRALRSAYDQTHRPSEIIVVDDGSVPAEFQAASEMVAQFPNARILRASRNRGPATARNRGWDAATSDWVAFLDSDDVWHPAKLEAQRQIVFESHPSPSLVSGAVIQVDAYSKLASLKLDGAVPRRRIRKRDLLIRNPIPTSSVVLRRNLDVRFPEGRRYSEDYELWLLVAARPAPMVHIRVPVEASFKAAYGESGLSSRVWSMSFGELAAYAGARREGALNIAEFGLAVAGSCTRSAIRLIRMAVRRLMGRKA